MYCQHCQKNFDDSSATCPHCGNVPEQANDRSKASKVVKRAMPFWFKLLCGIAVLLLMGVTAGILFTEKLVDVIDKQLEALRHNNIQKAYYDYSSKNFMAALNLLEFTHFIEQNPILLEQQTAHFTERSIHDNVSTMKGKIVTADHRETPIEYQLIKEGNQWKVLSIRVLKKRAKEEPQADALFKIIKRIKGQLQAIKNRNYIEAYDRYLSKEFKKEVNGPTFQSFLRKYPILENYKTASFYKGKEKNGVQSFSAILQSDSKAAYVKYYLIKEEGKWKILSMRIFNPEEAHLEPDAQVKGTMHLRAILLGSSTNPDGVIENPQTTFNSQLGDLYVTLDIREGVKGEAIEMQLKNLEIGTTIPFKVTLDEGGDILVASVFSPPVTGWLKGRYQLIVIPTTGESKVVDFEIN